MSRFFLIALISIHILGNTEVSQLFKLPILFNHYFEHSRNNPGITFSQFLNMHYGGDDGTDADNDRDNQLPCHDLQHTSIHALCFHLQESSITIAPAHQPVDNYQYPVTKEETPGHRCPLLRPPKQA